MRFLFFLNSLGLLLFSLTLHAHIKNFETPLVDHLHTIEEVTTPTGLEGVDCIYVINLKGKPEKWQHVKELFEKRNLHPSHLISVNGWSLIDGKAQKISGPYPTRLQAGEYGRLLSYISALKDAYERGFKCIWIAEDNLEIFGNVFLLPHHLKQLTEFDPDWDVFFPDVSPRYKIGNEVLRLKECSYDPRPDERLNEASYYQKKFRVNDDIMKIRSRPGFNSLLLSRKGIEKVLNYFTHVYVWSPFDVNLHTVPDLLEYSVRKDITSRWIQPKEHLQQSSDHPEDVAHELFQKALTQHSQNDLTKALDTFKKRAQIGGDPDEIFWSLYQIGCIEQNLNYDPEVFLEAFNQAYLFAPTRAEPLYRLAQHYRLTGEVNLGYLLANYALYLEKPRSQHVGSWIYHWGILMEHSLCSYYSGRIAAFDESNKKLLDDQTLPPQVRKCVEDNLKFTDLIHPNK